MLRHFKRERLAMSDRVSSVDGADNGKPAKPAKRRSWPAMSRLYREYLSKHMPALIAAFVCMAAIAVTSSAQTYLMGPLIDKVFIARDGTRLWFIAGAILVIFAVRSAARYSQEVLLVSLGQKIVADVQDRLFDKLVSADMTLFQSRSPGTLAALFTYDANALRLAVCDVFLVAGKDTLTILTMIGLMFYTNWRLALMCLVLPILSIAPMRLLGKQIHKISLQTQLEVGGLTHALTQIFQGIRTVRSYGLEAAEQARVNGRMTFLARLVVKAAWVGGAILPIVDGLGGLAVAIVIIAGGAQVIAHAITPGQLFVFVGAIVGAYAPVPSLSKVNVTLQTGLAAAERVFAAIDRAPAQLVYDQAQALQSVSGAVQFEAVHFAYDRGNPVLKGVDFVAPAGGVTAFVGRSGAGKSTIFSLITRLYDPQRGRVLINGLDIQTISLTSLRDCMAVVSQDIALFDDSIANNIRYGRLDAPEEAVHNAAAATGVLDFAARLRDGLETRIGEQGMRLSGGQRQCIAIARALLRDAPILLLDEPTDAQDAESERHIQRALKQLMRGRTTLVIAHRLRTIRHADIIHVVDNGQVVESGRHEELVAYGGIYAHLGLLQFADGLGQGGPRTAAGHVLSPEGLS